MATSTVNQETLKKQKKLSNQNWFKTVVTLIALFFVTPIGVWLAWWWCDWSKTIKIIVSIIFIALWIFSQFLARFMPQQQPVAFKEQTTQIEMHI